MSLGAWARQVGVTSGPSQLWQCPCGCSGRRRGWNRVKKSRGPPRRTEVALFSTPLYVGVDAFIHSHITPDLPACSRGEEGIEERRGSPNADPTSSAVPPRGSIYLLEKSAPVTASSFAALSPPAQPVRKRNRWSPGDARRVSSSCPTSSTGCGTGPILPAPERGAAVSARVHPQPGHQTPCCRFGL